MKTPLSSPRFALLFLFPLVCLLTAEWTALAATDSATTRPSVLMLVSEDNSEQLGCYGDPIAHTPNLDRLAAAGVRFTNAYVTQAGCSPSRASILTGLYPHQNGQIGLATHKFHMFESKIANLPSSLQAAGYRTGCLGKIHVNPEKAFGFDFHHDGKNDSFNKRDVAKFAEEAETFFRETPDGQPFFLMMNFADAHVPWLAQEFGQPEKLLTAKDVTSLPFVGLNTPEVLAATANYYNCMHRLDYGVGKVLEALEATGRRENTVIIYLSDHGAQMPRGKKTCYEGGVRIPLIFSAPGLIPEGKTSDALVSTLDLFPTLVELCGAPPVNGLPGRSLTPLWQSTERKEPPGARWRDYLFTEFTVHWPENLFPQRAVRDGRYKLIHNLFPNEVSPVCLHYRDSTSGGKKPRFEYQKYPDALEEGFQAAYATFERPREYELYDLQADPWELKNLAGDPKLSGERERLTEVLARWQVETSDELRHPEKLARLQKENDSTFVNGEYQHVGKRKDFEWEYPQYLKPGS